MSRGTLLARLNDEGATVTVQAMIESQLARGCPIPWMYDDGGRHDAGYRGLTGDCATRAVAIVSGLPYQDVYDMINEYAKAERPRANRRSNARLGVHAALMHRMLVRDLGWTWTSTMSIGSGTRVHVRRDELPDGRLIVRCSKHYAAVIDGVLHDIYDSSRNGARAVYGFWQPA